MKTFNEFVELQPLVEATGMQVKKWFKGKGVMVKASKAGTHHIRAIVTSGTIPNDIRKMALNVVAPTGVVQDVDNVNYGNIRSDSIAATIAQWDQIMGVVNEQDDTPAEDAKEKEYKMERNGKTVMADPDSVEDMKKRGWKVVEKGKDVD